MNKTYDIIVIGAGSGGLVVAIGAAKAKKRVLLIEKGNYGGDCTNYGCIPSKALIASSHCTNAIKNAKSFGIENSSRFDASKSLERVRQIVAKIRKNEEPEALKKFGVETLNGLAQFIDSHRIKVDDTEVIGKQIVLATGSYPAIPPVKGLSESPYLTNETIFDLKVVPKSIVFLGGGPISCELAQAFNRLGSKVTIIQRPPHLLKKEEPETRELLRKIFEEEGIVLHLGRELSEVQYKENAFTITFGDKTITAEKLVVAAGRKPQIAKLNLDEAGVHWSNNGIEVDPYGRTNKRHIWAIGDVLGGPLFTHFAEHGGRTVLKNLLLPFKKKIHNQYIPRVTFTDPEIASIGMLEEDALKKYSPSKIAIYHLPLTSIDRAITEGEHDGFIKILTKKWSSQILGACIVAPRAGEMLGQISLAMKMGIPLRKLSALIPPYPTYTQGIRKTADLYLTQTLLKIFKR